MLRRREFGIRCARAMRVLHAQPEQLADANEDRPARVHLATGERAHERRRRARSSGYARATGHKLKITSEPAGVRR